MCLQGLFGGGESKATKMLLSQSIAAQTAANEQARMAMRLPADSQEAGDAADARMRRLLASGGQGWTLSGNDFGAPMLGTKMLLGA